MLLLFHPGIIIASLCLWITCDAFSCRLHYKARGAEIYPASPSAADDIGFCGSVTFPCVNPQNFTSINDDSCKNFFRCQLSVLQSCTCQEGTRFNPITKKCETVAPNFPPCTCSGQRTDPPTTPSPTDPAKTTPSDEVTVPGSMSGASRLSTMATTEKTSELETGVIAVVAALCVILPVLLVVFLCLCYRKGWCQHAKKDPTNVVSGKERHVYAEVNDKMVRGEHHWFSQDPPPIPKTQPPSVTSALPSRANSAFSPAPLSMPPYGQNGPFNYPTSPQQYPVQVNSPGTPRGTKAPPFSQFQAVETPNYRRSSSQTSFPRTTPRMGVGYPPPGAFTPHSSLPQFDYNSHSPEGSSCSSNQTSVDSHDIGLHSPLHFVQNPTNHPTNYMSKALHV